jgi:signal transduction histidine kinase
MNAFSDIGDILASLLDGLPWPALLVNEAGQVTFVNRELKEREQLPAQATGARLDALFPQYAAALQGAVPWLESQDVDVQNPRTGAQQRLCVRRLPLGACLIVAELPRREFDLGSAQTARLASLGFMVAGVCHEVANPLTAIHSMVQLLQSSQPLAPETLERGLANIASNVQRVLNITRKLNDFSRSGSEDRTLLRVDQVIADAVQNARARAVFREVAISVQPGPELWLLGATDQLERVFSNILLNAAQAMNGRGSIEITLREAAPLRGEIAFLDSGPGIAPGHLPRLFEPFFTTKPAGQGTGLGLAISNEIVIEHGGSLRAENHPRGGACFYVSLPLHERRS